MKKYITLIALFCSFAFAVSSQTKQIENLQKQRKALQLEIENTNRLFIDIRKQASTILQRIGLINRQIEARKEMIALYRKEIDALENEQLKLQREIDSLTVELNEKKENYAKAIKSIINRNLTENKLFFVLSGKSLGESLRRMQYLKQYSKWQKTQAEEIKAQNVALLAKKEALDKAKADKQEALTALQTQQNFLLQEEQKRKKEVADAKSKQQELQKILQDKQKKATKLNTEIQRLIAQEVARQEREARRKAEEAERKRREKARREAAEREKRRREQLAEEKRTREKQRNKKSKSKTTEKQQIEDDTQRKQERQSDTSKKNDVYVASAESFNLSKNFAANKGRLPMPVTGAATIISGFGKQTHREWNVTTNSGGVDIQAQKGADIRAVFDGEVTSVVAFPGYNNCVIVRHGDYYTFYGNIVNLYVKNGQKVKAGQVLGKIFTDNDTGVTTMHFQLWRKTTKLNPEPWLR